MFHVERSRRIAIEQDRRGYWTWHCYECGWAGLGCWSASSARDEAKRHVCPPPERAHL